MWRWCQLVLAWAWARGAGPVDQWDQAGLAPAPETGAGLQTQGQQHLRQTPAQNGKGALHMFNENAQHSRAMIAVESCAHWLPGGSKDSRKAAPRPLSLSHLGVGCLRRRHLSAAKQLQGHRHLVIGLLVLLLLLVSMSASVHAAVGLPSIMCCLSRHKRGNMY